MGNDSVIDVSNIPFLLCIVILGTAIGFSYLIAWALGFLLVVILDEIHSALQGVISGEAPPLTIMDRFTRTREHYLRGVPRNDSQQPRATLKPAPAADLNFDFDFGNSKLDLNLTADGSTNHNPPRSPAQASDPISDQIGIAISDDSDFPQRGRSRLRKPCITTAQSHKEQGLKPNQDITALPSIPSEGHIRFNARNDNDSKKPSCSIYSREGRQQVRSETNPPRQVGANGAAIENATDPSEVSSDSMAEKNFQEANGTSEPERLVTVERERSAFTKDQTDTSPLRPSQTSSTVQPINKDKTKRPSGLRKILPRIQETPEAQE